MAEIYLKRKIDTYLFYWKKDTERKEKSKEQQLIWIGLFDLLKIMVNHKKIEV